MARVYRRKDSPRLYLEYEDERGRTTRHSSGTSDWQEAEIQLKQLLAEVERRKAFRDQPKFIEVAMALIDSQKKPNTRESMESSLIRWSLYLDQAGFDPRTMYLGELTIELVAGFIAHERARGVGDPSIRVRLSFVSKVFETAVIRRNPVRELLMTREIKFKKARPQVRPITKGEEKALLDACNRIDHACMIVVAIECGLRPNEIYAITPEHVTGKRTFLLPASMNKDSTIRTVPITNRAMDALRQVWPKEETALFFPSRRGNGRYYTASWWGGVRKRAGVDPKIRFYDCRHTFATRYLQDGGRIEKLQRILGHDDLETTMVYVHLTDSDVIEDADRVEKLRLEANLAQNVLRFPTRRTHTADK